MDNKLWRRRRILRALSVGVQCLLIVVVVAGCVAPASPGAQLSELTGILTVGLIEGERAAYAKEFRLDPRPAGSPREVAEAYMQRYQPGPLPRLFESTIVYDRRGRVVAELFDEGRRTWVPLTAIAPTVRDAIVATEDGTFYTNDGVDKRRLLGALLQNTQQNEIVSGASTITMQLARNLFLTPEERFDLSLQRKAVEILLAQDLTRLFTKDELLEMYLNLVYFGHRAYGVEAAAQTYFGKAALALDLAEASLLAGIPQAPANLDPFANLDAAKQRQRIVLDLMVRRGYVTPTEAEDAVNAPIHLAQDPDALPLQAPHFLQYLDVFLSRQPQAYNLRRSGLRVYSSLDLDLQALAQETVTQQVNGVRSRFNLNNAALVALKPGPAEILAMVGSADFFDDNIDGQVNVAIRQRQPGSAIKPIIYAAAFEQGTISPATLLWDLPVQYPTTDGKVYAPVNYDRKFRGPVTVRTALASSLNVPTVKMFEGQDPVQFLETANRMGIASYSPDRLDRFGLATALGASEVSLLELTTAYHTLANEGGYVPPTPVLRLTDGNGRPLPWSLGAETGQAVDPATAFLVTNILSDNDARAPVFGANSRLRLSRPAAAKTGTTTDFRDNWTVGFTRYLVAGVWAGNNDGQPMRNADGITGAGPIWNLFMEAVLADPELVRSLGGDEEDNAWEFTAPDSVVQVDQECPADLRCPAGGEYFSRSWLQRTGAWGPYADSFVTGIMRVVEVERPDGARTPLGLCVEQLTDLRDPRAVTALSMPQGVGRLGTGLILTGPGADGDSVGTRNGRAPLASLTRDEQNTASTSDRVRQEQGQASRWAATRGELLVLADCSRVAGSIRLVYGDTIRAVVLSEPVAQADLAARVAALAPADVVAQPVESRGGLTRPTRGEIVAGVIPVQGVAWRPDFWKWQLDLQVDGAGETFIALGETAAQTPATLTTLDTARYPNGDHVLRLRVVRRDGNYDEYFTPVTFANP